MTRTSSTASGRSWTRSTSESVFTERRRILVATGDTLAPQMAGPAIRAWQIACALCREHDVELVSDDRVPRDLAPRLPRCGRSPTPSSPSWCSGRDVTIFQGYLMNQHPVLLHTNKVIVADIYDPFHLEQLEQARDAGEAGRRIIVRAATEVLNEQLTRGDLFLCASRKQRDFWLGQLAAVGRVNPVTYDADESMDELVKVVPFGVSDDPPRHTRPVLKGVVPGIGPDDKVILWGGGIYNWFDPLTLLRAVDKLRGARSPRCGCSSSGSSTRTRTCPRCGWRWRPGGWPTSSASPTRTCSSTRAGSRTTTARTSCSRPTSA